MLSDYRNKNNDHGDHFVRVKFNFIKECRINSFSNNVPII